MTTGLSRLFEPLESRSLFSVVTGFEESTFVTGLSAPTAMAFAPDGRLFVCEQGGALRVVKNGQLLTTPALGLDVDSQGERGLLGIAFDPDFANTSQIYLYYTATTPTLHNRVSRFQLSGDVAAAGSEQVLLDMLPLSAATNHNGGALHFGPDGKLYVAVGENANPAAAQSLNTTLGKILRLNADGSIPADNPFLASTFGQNQAIWALGLRNPFTFAFDPATGAMHINDVGQSSFEEVNVGQAGANYGWPQIEGKRTTELPPSGYVDPLLTYPHSGGAFNGIAITGGAFYRAGSGATQPFPDSFKGQYFFADLGAGFVRSLNPQTKASSDFASGLNLPVDLRVGPDGSLYALEYGAGRVTQFEAGPAAPLDVDLVAGIAVESEGTDVAQGDKDRVVVLLSNAGTDALTGKATVTVSLVPADGADPSQAQLLRELRPSVRLQPGQEKRVRVRFRYPDVAGAFRVEVVATPDVAQTTTANDVAQSTGTVAVSPPFVDLSPAFRLPIPEPVRVGGKQNVVIDVTNGGNVSFRGKLDVRLRTSSDSVASDDDAIVRSSRPQLSIAPEASRGIRLRFTLPEPLQIGTYFLLVELDPGGLIAESDEANNAVGTMGPGPTAQ